MTRRLIGICILGVALSTPAAAQGGQAALGAAAQRVRAAMAAGNHETSVRVADSLWRAFSGHPNLVLLRAQALVAAGRLDDAEQAVRRLLAWDARYARRALQDSILARLRPRLEAVVTPLATRADSNPTGRGKVVATIEERDLVPEGTAWEPGTRSILIGSLNKSTIIAIAPDGRISDRVPRGSNGLASVAGIHVDTTRGILYATSNARFDRQDDTTRSAVYAFEAATGRFRGRYDLPAPGPSFLNDLTTGPDGSVYVTDSRAGAVLVLRPGATTLARFEAAGVVTSPNGITTSPDGRHLFFSDMDFIRVVPLAGGAPWQLVIPDSINVFGVDGLAFIGNGLIAHHPLNYWRVVHYAMDPGYRRITGRTLIEHSTPDSRTSTTGEVAGDNYVYIGNSQIDRMNTRTIDATKMDPIRIYAIPWRNLSGGSELRPNRPE